MNRRFVIARCSPPRIARPTLLLSGLSVALLAGTLALTGCGGTADTDDRGAALPTATGAPASGTNSVADVTFANGVIAHHTQAVRMADMALAQASSPEVNELAAAIKAAQGPEVERMSGCLTRWGKTGPETMDHTMGMPGSSMDEVTPAQTELKDGNDTDAMQLAREIIGSHPAQITRMQELLKSLS